MVDCNDRTEAALGADICLLERHGAAYSRRTHESLLAISRVRRCAMAGRHMPDRAHWRRWVDQTEIPAQPGVRNPAEKGDSYKARVIARDQRLRFHRFRLALIGYGFFYVVTAYLWWDGQLTLDGIGFLALFLGSVSMNIVFGGMILSGRNLALRDPSMTAVQTLGLIIVSLVLAWASGTVVSQNAAAMALVVGLLFGMFRLDARGLSVLAGLGFAGFALIAMLHVHRLDQDVHGTFVRLVVVGGTLVWTTVFASYVGQLRKRLSSRNSELKIALAALEDLAKHDGLTGIFNRREIFIQLEEAIEEGLRLGTPVSISLFDLDGFKSINDAYGHSIGDDALREFVRRVKASARSLDRLGRVAKGAGFGRYGGEEFLLVMPMTSLEGARDAAERIREAVSGEPFLLDGNEIRVTVSQGVAEAGPKERTDHLLARVDRALYQAKRDGRDCVRVAEPADDDSGVVREGAGFFQQEPK